ASSGGIGAGSEFVVRLPAVPAAADDAPPPVPPAHSNRLSRRVLVVDDNVDAAKSAAMLLKIVGHELMIVHDGVSALQAAADFRPEIILLDIGLPGMSGYEVARTLRANPE